MSILQKVLMHSTLRGFKGWNPEEASLELISIVREDKLSKDRGWELRHLANIYCIIKEIQDFNKLFICEGKSCFDEVTRPIKNVNVSNVNLFEVAYVTFASTISVHGVSNISITQMKPCAIYNQIVDESPSFRDAGILCEALRVGTVKALNIVADNYIIVFLALADKMSGYVMLNMFANVRQMDFFTHVCNKMALAHRFDLRDMLQSTRLFAVEALKLHKIGIMSINKICNMREFLNSEDIDLESFKGLLKVLPQSEKGDEMIKSLNEMTPLSWYISKLNIIQVSYYLGFDISLGSPNNRIISQRLIILCDLGHKEYYKKTLPKWKEEEIYGITTNDTGGENLLCHSFSDYNPFDVLSYLDGNKVYYFTRDSLKSIMSKDIPVNPYNRQPFSRSFVERWEYKTKLAMLYSLPDAAPMVEVCDNLLKKRMG